MINQNDKNYFEKLEDFLIKNNRINQNKIQKKTLIIYNDIKNIEEIYFENENNKINFENYADSYELYDNDNNNYENNLNNNYNNNNIYQCEYEKNINFLKLKYNLSFMNLSNLTRKYFENYIADNFL
jgi:hypothetical protein